MIISKTAGILRQSLAGYTNKTIGFTPTMGALHEGHLSLIRKSKASCDITVCSIFVNPTQFNDAEDFKKYPVTIDEDIKLLQREGCDMLFLPSVQEIYPEGTRMTTKYSLGDLENILEGAFRPGHFQGVCQVVDRLLSIVLPDKLFMGSKDYQQCMVVKKLLGSYERFSGIELVVAPVVREPSGLAKSSRNRRLSPEALTKAALLYDQLVDIRQNLKPGDNGPLPDSAIKNLLEGGFEKVDYLTLAGVGDLHPIERWDGREKVVVLAAAFIDGVRLIDNVPVTEY